MWSKRDISHEIDRMREKLGMPMKDEYIKAQIEAARMQQEIQVKKMEIEMQMQIEKMRMASPQPGYTMNIVPSHNGGYVMTFDGKTYVSMDAEELARTIITAVVAKKIKG
jgi:hypothetical protein